MTDGTCDYPGCDLDSTEYLMSGPDEGKEFCALHADGPVSLAAVRTHPFPKPQITEVAIKPEDLSAKSGIDFETYSRAGISDAKAVVLGQGRIYFADGMGGFKEYKSADLESKSFKFSATWPDPDADEQFPDMMEPREPSFGRPRVEILADHESDPFSAPNPSVVVEIREAMQKARARMWEEAFGINTFATADYGPIEAYCLADADWSSSYLKMIDDFDPEAQIKKIEAGEKLKAEDFNNRRGRRARAAKKRKDRWAPYDTARYRK